MVTKSVKSLSKQLAGVAKQAKSLGINTGKADAMVAQTNRQGSKSFSGSNEEKAYLSTVPAQMTTETPAKIPTLTLPNVGDVLGAGNAGLATGLADTSTTYDAGTGQFVTSPAQTTPTDHFQSLFEQATQLGNTAFNEMGTNESRLAQLEKENKIKQKQQAVNDYTGQLNSITASRDASVLALEGQGRGQTSGFIGGEQARINREAAIAALPVQAQLATAQNNLQMAQEHVDKMFQIQSQDALARYQYKSKLIESVYSFATGQEQRRLDAIKAKEDRAYDEQKTNLALKNDWAKTAVEYGQSTLAGSIMKLDPSSATFTQDLARLQGQVVKPVAPKAPVKRETQVVGNKLIDTQTGEVISTIDNSNGVDEKLQTMISNADPVSTKSALASLLSSSSIAPATKARISPSLAVLNSIDDLANSNLEGSFTGIGGFGRIKEGIKGLFNMKSTEATNNEQAIDAINLKVQQWASGASLTAQQTEQVNNFTPTKGDSDKQVRAKANGLYNFMLKQTQSELLTDGVNVNFPTINLFEIRDLYEKASPEQRKVIEETYFNKK